MLLPGDDPGGFIVTTIIGIVGALIGGLCAAARVTRMSWPGTGPGALVVR